MWWPPCNSQRHEDKLEVPEVEVPEVEVPEVEVPEVEVPEVEVPEVEAPEVEVPEVDIHEELFKFIRLYADHADFHDDKIHDFVDQMLDLNKLNLCAVINTYDKLLHHVDIDSEACSCKHECRTSNLVLQDLLVEGVKGLIHAPGYSLHECIEKKVGNITLHLSLFLPDGIDFNEDGIVSSAEIVETNMLLDKLKKNLHGFKSAHIAAELFEAIKLMKKYSSDHALLADFYDFRIYHLDMKKSPNCDTECHTPYSIMTTRVEDGGIEIFHEGHIITTCQKYTIGSNILHLHFYEQEKRQVFRELDADESGDITRNEVPHMSDEQYNVMDLDGDGDVDLEEYEYHELDGDCIVTQLEIISATT